MADFRLLLDVLIQIYKMCSNEGKVFLSKVRGYVFNVNFEDTLLMLIILSKSFESNFFLMYFGGGCM